MTYPAPFIRKAVYGNVNRWFNPDLGIIRENEVEKWQILFVSVHWVPSCEELPRQEMEDCQQ